jgi:hypothetical protein
MIDEEIGMPAKRELSMRQLRHLLWLHHDGVSAREIGRRLARLAATVAAAKWLEADRETSLRQEDRRRGCGHDGTGGGAVAAFKVRCRHRGSLRQRWRFFRLQSIADKRKNDLQLIVLPGAKAQGR